MTEQKLQINLIRAATNGETRRPLGQWEYLAQHYLVGLAELSVREPFGEPIISLLYRRALELVDANLRFGIGAKEESLATFIVEAAMIELEREQAADTCKVCTRHAHEHDLNEILHCKALWSRWETEISLPVANRQLAPEEIFGRAKLIWDRFLELNPTYKHKARYTHSEAQNAKLFTLFKGV